MLPPRTTEIASDEAEALAQAQPERGRSYVRLRRGEFRGLLSERSDGTLALSRESWSLALRVRCIRPASYAAFSVVRTGDPTSWCGVPLGRGSVIEVNRDWELTSGGPLEALSFAVLRSSLEQVERQLAADDPGARPTANRLLVEPSLDRLGRLLAHRVMEALSVTPLGDEAHAARQAEFLRFAARLRRWGLGPAGHLESASRRRAAVRRVEEYLDAQERTLPSVATLCAIADVSERTLEYAFREQIGVTPARYLRLRRLNWVRRDLRAGGSEVQVTEVAMRWGFWQLGRFAAEYRALFGERPSDTAAPPGSLRGSRPPTRSRRAPG